MLNVCCVNVNNFEGRGAQYVNALCLGVKRHLSLPHRFLCFTDKATDMNEVRQDVDIDQRIEKYGFTTWWAKMWLFSPYAFAPGERVLYLDLDTIVTGSLDEIASYDGPFALLEDLFFPGQWGSGLMAWTVNERTLELWRRYEELGFPQDDPAGDQSFLMQHLPRDYVDLWQDLYPGQVISFKASGKRLSPEARVVCFHGTPRPHEVQAGWVPAYWE